jgi:exodeoxyribonuclease VII large subunit
MGKVYSVTQITSYLKSLIGRDAVLRALSVKGELSNVKYHSSGHIYFTIKDDGAAMSGVMFASDAYALDFELSNGMKVEITGAVGIYEKAGSYQIYAKKITKEGRGELYERYLALKAELEEMGMFAEQYKQPIPEYIKRLGVVTAPTGAAVRDIINIAKRRDPYIEIILYPAKVQGEGAAESVAQGIRVLDAAGVDVIIAGRGGGSIEDLWAFNERTVAEAIFNCSTPLISAVGHETDTTIADFAADLRAPTPSAAAELAVFDYEELISQFGGYREALRHEIERMLSTEKLRVREYVAALKEKRPDAVINAKKMRLADTENRMRRAMRETGMRDLARLERLETTLPVLMRKRLDKARHAAAIYAERLKGVSPLEKLTMGYSYVSDEKGKNIRDARKLSEGDTINIYMLHGKVTADVKRIEEDEH